MAVGLTGIVQWILGRPTRRLLALQLEEPTTETPEPLGPAGDRSFPGAIEAYLDFLTAAMKMAGHLEAIGSLGIPPPFRGAAWSWPLAFRALRGIQESSNEVPATFVRVKTLGSARMTEVAYSAAMAIARAMKELPTTHPQAADPQAHRFGESIEQVRRSLVDFETLVRSGLEERPELDT